MVNALGDLSRMGSNLIKQNGEIIGDFEPKYEECEPVAG